MDRTHPDSGHPFTPGPTMTREDMLEMTEQSGVLRWGSILHFSLEELERFAALVAAHEREACAVLCDNAEKRKWTTFVEGGTCTGISAADCARAIRARGND